MTPIIGIKANIQKAIAAIGTKNGTAPPESTSNTFGIAYEFFVAGVLRSVANKRYDVAKANAFDAGLIGSHETYVEGNTITTSQNEYFDITAKKASSSKMIDPVMLKNELSKRYGEVEAVKIIQASSKLRNGAVTIDCAMKVEG